MEINNSCCCCLLRPPDKHLKMPYTRLGKTEIYANMIKECFEIQLVIQSDEVCGICAVCVGRLRDASDFKLQVQRIQEVLSVHQGMLHLIEDLEKTEISDDIFGPDCEEQIHVSEEIKTEVTDDPLPGDECKELKKLLMDEGIEDSKICKEHYELPAEGPAEQKSSDIHDTSDQDPHHNFETRDHNESGAHKKSYTCDICKKRCVSKRGYSAHMSRIHNNRYTCQICNKGFKRTSLLKKHKRCHAVVKNYGGLNKRSPHSLSTLTGEDLEKTEILSCEEELINVTEIKTEVLDDPLPSDEDKGFKGFMMEEGKVSQEVPIQEPLTNAPPKEHYEQSAEIPLERQESVIVPSERDTRQGPETGEQNIESGWHKNTYTCDICKRQLLSKIGIRIHMSIHKRSNICGICNKQFKWKSLLKKHSYTHSGEKPYGCEICRKGFLLKSTLDDHKLIHAGRFLTCDMCNKQFRTKRTLIGHIRLHTGQKSRCQFCFKKLAKSSLSKHIRSQHCYQNTYYECDECKRVFKHKSNLVAHLNVHSKWDLYQCNVCKKTLVSDASLRRHKLIHTGERAFPCEICNYRFYEKHKLETHLTIHTGVKKHCCEVCGKRFARSDYLKRHLYTHVTGISFSCERCTKSYSTKEGLRQHKRTHLEKTVAKSKKKKSK